MKTHAAIGANIVARINFPYPVEPIVRHHHETWDGRGYPDGLAATDIPVGCRILAIIDCFDALRSHRPYRRQLSEEEALEIVVSRRGTMYDPDIVDAFVSIRAQLKLGETDDVTAPLESGVDTLAEDSATRSLQSAMGDRSGGALPAWLLAVEPNAVVVLYRHDRERSVLRPTLISHGDLTLFGEFAIPVGKRLSGWVAANQEVIMNSDPQIDFEDQIADLQGLRSCLCVPVLEGSEVHGVVSLYSDTLQAFSGDQRSIVERMAPELVQFLCRRSVDSRFLELIPTPDHQSAELKRRPPLQLVT